MLPRVWSSLRKVNMAAEGRPEEIQSVRLSGLHRLAWLTGVNLDINLALARGEQDSFIPIFTTWSAYGFHRWKTRHEEAEKGQKQGNKSLNSWVYSTDTSGASSGTIGRGWRGWGPWPRRPARSLAMAAVAVMIAGLWGMTAQHRDGETRA